MTRMRILPVVTLVGLLAGWAPAVAGDHVSVNMDGQRLTWRLGGKTLGAGASWLQVRDLAADEAFLSVPVSAKQQAFQGSVAGLDFSGRWKAIGDAWELACDVSAQPARDRAIVVRVALPLEAVGWTWWDDIYLNRRIAPDKDYSNLIHWGGPRRVSTYMCCAVTGREAGVSLAVPLHEPRVFRLAYNSTRRALEAEIDLGLSPDLVKRPCRADFRLLVYAHDPHWGFRDALRRYYELFPQYAVRRLGEGGIWLLSLEPAKMACPWDWGLRYDEGAQFHAGYDCAHDILPFVYTEPWGRYEGFGRMPTPDGKGRYGSKAAILTPEQLKQSVLDRLKLPPGKDGKIDARREWAETEVNSAIEREDGSWIWNHWTDIWSPGNWLSNICLNPDPDLPPPSLYSMMWKRELDPGFAAARKDGGVLGGVYFDSVCGYVGFWPENFRRQQWQYDDIPLVASWKARKPVQLHAFSCYKLGLEVVRRMQAEGKFTMGNTGPPEMAWFCPMLDMVGTGEHGIGLQADKHYAYMRAYGYRKPMSPMAYELVNPAKSWQDKERAMHRMLFYAVHPGTGPFMDPLKYEPSRPLFRYYEPIITWLDLAGWQPVTAAKATTPEILVERYGPGEKELTDVTFIALRNTGKQAAKASVEIESRAMPKGAEGETIGWLMVADRPLKLSPAENAGLVASDIPIAADATEVVVLGRRQSVARLWMRQAQQWLDRLAREAVWLGAGSASLVRNGDFEAGLSGWGLAAPPNNARNAEIAIDESRPLSGKRSVKIASRDGTSRHGLNLGPALAAEEEYTLRFQYAWSRPAHAKGTFVPRFGIKGPDGQYVSSKYIHFAGIRPTDDQPAVYEKQFTIPAGHAAGFFQFMFEGNWGTIRIDDVEISSRKTRESRANRERLAADARRAADSLQTEPGRNLLPVIGDQEAVYRKLRHLAQSLPDEHVRRCLLLPAENFAEALGRAAEVLTDVALGLPENPPFADAAPGSTTAVKCNLRAGAKPIADARLTLDGADSLTARMPDKSPWGWEDVLVIARFRCENQPVWLPRRATLRLRAPQQVSPASR